MIQIIAGTQGNGKTKYLLDKVNREIKSAHGNIVYLDKNAKQMYELNNKVRLIDVSEFPISNPNAFIGFICGIISQDHDLEQVYVDSFLKAAKVKEEELADILSLIDRLGDTYHITFVLSISLDSENLPEAMRDHVIVSL